MSSATRVAVVLLALALPAGAQTPPSLFADRNFPAGVGKITDLSFSPDGRLVAVVGSSGGVAVWDAQSGAPVRQVALSKDAVTHVAFGGPGTLAVGTDRGAVSTLSLLTGLVREVARHDRSAAVTAVAMSPDGTTGASGDAMGDILVWSHEGGQPAHLREDTKRVPIVFLAFASPTTLVSITKELAVTTWDVPKRRRLRSKRNRCGGPRHLVARFLGAYL